MSKPRARITTYGGEPVNDQPGAARSMQHWQLEVDGQFIADTSARHELPVWEAIVEAINGTPAVTELDLACRLVMTTRGHTMASIDPPVYAPNTVTQAESLLCDLKSGLPVGAFRLDRRQGELGECQIFQGGVAVFAGVDLAATLQDRPLGDLT